MRPLTIILSFNAFDPHVIWLAALTLVLICLSAFTSGAETAFFSLTPTTLNAVKKEHSRSDQAIMKLMHRQDYLLATLLVLGNLVNIFIILIINRIIDLAVGFDSTIWEFVVKTVVVAFMLLLFAEIMPKIYSAYNSLGFARMAARPLLVARAALRPLSYLLIKSSSLVSNSLARKRGVISMDELSNAIEITHTQTEEERQMLTGIVSFVNTDVEQIMKPRVDMVTLDTQDDFGRVRKVIIDSGFSRIPVCEQSIDNIKGILYVKDVIAHMDKADSFDWRELLRKPYFVPEHKKINDLMEEFRASKVHVAIVVDEYGSTAGLVSLEDILEEIVGEIADESDAQQIAGYVKVDDDTYIFDGKTHLNDMLKVIGADEAAFDDVRGKAETVAGLLLEARRDFIHRGESLTIHGMIFTVTAIVGRRIDKIRVNLKP